VAFPESPGCAARVGLESKSDGARDAARRQSAAQQTLKKAKLDEHDTFFEVLDARSGKSLGAVLAQVGSHASSFDAAFSAGDSLILSKTAFAISFR